MTPTKKAKSEFKVVFRGVRGSHPVSGKKYQKYGGYTSCYEVRAGNCIIIIDAGTGIIDLGKEMIGEYIESGKDLESREPLEAIILFTHVHVDHVQGLPFFAPMNLADSTFYFYGPDAQGFSFEEAIGFGVEPPIFPISIHDMHSVKLFRSITGSESIYWSDKKGIPNVVNNFREIERKKKVAKTNPVKISFMKSYAHPNSGVFIYKIEYNKKTIVLATDTEGYVGGDSKLIKFSRNADLLIHDAGYTEAAYSDQSHCKQGYGHSTMTMAVDVAKKANVKQLALVHHEPANDDKIVDKIEKNAKKLFPNSFAAFGGQEVII
ncbi:MAG: MBL fold metallo-hydrolase [bacterium]|nr:MBL fold metallo-hydrolase [bacterium]